MGGVERFRKFALSLVIYLYVYSVKLMKIFSMVKIFIILKYCNIGKYIRVYFKILLLEFVFCFFRK